MNHSIEHRGYIIVQTSLNWHCMILDGENVLMHLSRTSPCSDDELREMIDFYIDELEGNRKLWEAYKGARENVKEEDGE